MKIRGKYLIFNGEVEGIKDSNIDMECEKKVYEVIRIVDGKPLFFIEHADRMCESIKMTYGENCLESKEEFVAETLLAVEGCIEANKIDIGNIQLLFYIKDDKMSNFAYFIQHSYPTEEQYNNGVKSVFIDIERENPHAKVLKLDYKNKVREILEKEDAYEGILLDGKGNVTEGSRSNIFFVKDGGVLTASSEKVLEGITRMKVIQVISELGIKLDQVEISNDMVCSMDGVFMTGTSPEVLPINSVGDYEFKSAELVEVRDVLRLYREKCKEDLNVIEDRRLELVKSLKKSKK